MSTPEPQPVTLRNSLGEAVPVVTDDQGNMRAAAPNGRLVVAAGQIIASAWGNTTFDQTMMTFASVADRTNQWPVPTEGALSYLVDTGTPWLFRAGAWRAVPLGYLTGQVGPASQTDIGGTLTGLVGVSFNVVAGRAYRISAYAAATIINASAGGATYRIRWSTPGTGNVDTWFLSRASIAVNDVVAGGGVTVLTPTSTGAGAALLVVGTGSGGLARFAPSSAQIVVEDIGGT